MNFLELTGNTLNNKYPDNISFFTWAHENKFWNTFEGNNTGDSGCTSVY
jgi:hypothetical protein